MGGTCLRPSHLMQPDCHWSFGSWRTQNCHDREEARDTQGQWSKHPTPHPIHICPTCGRELQTWIGHNSHLITPPGTLYLVIQQLISHLVISYSKGQITSITCFLVNKLFNYINSLSMTIISFKTSIFQFQIVLLWW